VNYEKKTKGSPFYETPCITVRSIQPSKTDDVMSYTNYPSMVNDKIDVKYQLHCCNSKYTNITHTYILI